jgi:hypothetical protein
VARIDRLRRRVVGGPGRLDAAVRHAAFAGAGVPDDLSAYVEKVRLHAYKVVDVDLDRLRRTGRTDDELFEVTVAAALGAGLSRLERVLDVMEARGAP